MTGRLDQMPFAGDATATIVLADANVDGEVAGATPLALGGAGGDRGAGDVIEALTGCNAGPGYGVTGCGCRP